MAYVPVPKDLTKVKSKFIFNLTKRQVICFGLGALVGVPLFFPLEVLMKHFIQARFIRPRIRVYQTENFYATIEQNIRNKREVRKILHGKEKGKNNTDPG